MKKVIVSIVMIALAFGLTGCLLGDDDTKEKAKQLTFSNQSHYTVQVIPLTVDFGAF